MITVQPASSGLLVSTVAPSGPPVPAAAIEMSSEPSSGYCREKLTSSEALLLPDRPLIVRVVHGSVAVARRVFTSRLATCPARAPSSTRR